MILFIRNDFHQVTWCIIRKIDTIIFIMQCTLVFDLFTFTLIKTNNAPLVTYYF